MRGSDMTAGEGIEDLGFGGGLGLREGLDLEDVRYSDRGDRGRNLGDVEAQLA